MLAPMPMTVCIDRKHGQIPWKQQDKPVLVKLSNIAVLATPQREQGRDAFETGRIRIKRARLHADDTLREINWRERTNNSTGRSDSQATYVRYSWRTASPFLRRNGQVGKYTKTTKRFFLLFCSSCRFGQMEKPNSIKDVSSPDWKPPTRVQKYCSSI